MENIIILYGGTSGEHEVSLRSAGSVFRHIDKTKYSVTLIGIDTEGKWYLQNSPRYGEDGESLTIEKDSPVSITPGEGFFSGGKLINTDFVFPVLHGTFGEDGTIQGLLDMVGIPYAGSGVLGSAAGMDKSVSKLLWQQKGLPVVPCMEVRTDSKTVIEEAEREYGYPLFVKPARAGSSVGVRRAENRDELYESVEYAFQFDSKLVIEPSVTGRELECSVIGNTRPESFPPGEILLEKGFYDYESKYLNTENAKTVVPADLKENEKRKIMELAVEAFRAVGAHGFARVDFFMEIPSKRILINEINTIPGFTSISMFAKMCESAGTDYASMLDRVITLGKEIFDERKKLKRLPEDLEEQSYQ